MIRYFSALFQGLSITKNHDDSLFFGSFPRHRITKNHTKPCGAQYLAHVCARARCVQLEKFDSSGGVVTRGGVGSTAEIFVAGGS